MAAEAAIDEKFLAFAWTSEFEEEDAAGEVIDIGEAKGYEGGGKFGGDDVGVEGGEALLHCGP